MSPATIHLPAVSPYELWLVRLAQDRVEPDLNGLDAQERERAARFKFERDRRRYVDAHLALRRVLAGRTGRAAAALEFVAGAYGKPRLAGPASCAFSLSHSDDLALIALADDGEIGVDLERVRPLPDLDALAHQCLTAQERQALAAVPQADRPHAFLQSWTRKEACLKALGTGLQVEPATFAVGRDGDGDEALVRIETAAGTRSVIVRSLNPDPDWVAAVARVTNRSEGG